MRSRSSFPKLSSPAVLSPMAGVTDVAFRTLAKKYGAGVTYTEFISSAAITRAREKTEKMLVIDPSEKPVAVQLFGSSFTEVVDAARAVEDRFDVIDINCGCPAWKVIKQGAGSELLKKPAGIAKLVNLIASAVQKPVTVKIRTGIDERHINAVEVARTCEDAGAAALAIHGRTQRQGYSGEADWNIIKQVKDAINIPVIGNGDVFTPETFKQRLEESGVNAIMLARGAMGNPYLFQQVNDFLNTGTYLAPHKPQLFNELFILAKKYALSFTLLKSHAMQFTKGMTNGGNMRKAIMPCKTVDALQNIFSSVSNETGRTSISSSQKQE